MAGEPVQETANRFRHEPLDAMANWVKDRPGLGPILDWKPESGRPIPLPISEHPDKVVSTTAGYGAAMARPEDFLSSFAQFVRDNINKVAALQAVVQRPRELTRDTLKAVRMELDQQGFSEAALRNAWKQANNEDIAASIVGFIRQAAMGDPLVPWAERVKTAMDRIVKPNDAVSCSPPLAAGNTCFLRPRSCSSHCQPRERFIECYCPPTTTTVPCTLP